MSSTDKAARSLAGRASTVAGFTLLSRVLGYARDAIMAHIFGAGAAFDAFIAAQTIPNVLRRLVAEGTLMIAFVPILAEEKERGGLEAMRRFMRAVLGALMPLLMVLVGAGILLPEVAIKLFAAGFDEARVSMAVPLTQVMMPYLFFVSLLAVASGVLNTQDRFAAPAAAPVILNLAIIASVLGFRHWFDAPITAAAWGVTVGGLGQLLIQLPYLAKERLLVLPALDYGHPSLRLLALRMLPAVFGVGVYQLNIIVIRQLASFLPGGQLSCYFFASRLQEFALGVFAVSISVAALPTLSQHAARKDRAAFLSTYRSALQATTFVTALAVTGLVALSEPIVLTLFGHGAFDEEATRNTAQLVTILALGLVPIGAIRVMVPTLYAVGDTKTPVAAAALSLVITLSLGLGLSPSFEIWGLAFSTTAAAATQAAALSWLVGQRLAERLPDSVAASKPLQPAAKLGGHAIRCMLAAAPGGGAVFWLASSLVLHREEPGRNLALLVALGALLTGSYLALAHWLGIEEPRKLTAAVRQRILRWRG